ACSCGMALPRIRPVAGRLADALRTPSGRRITGGLSGLFLGYDGVVRQLQLVQHPDLTVTLRYVPDPAAETHRVEAAVRAAVGRLASLADGDLQVRAEAVRRVEGDGGKARLVLVVKDAGAPGAHRPTVRLGHPTMRCGEGD